MAKIELHPDFKDFLKLLNLNAVKYLVVGGYAMAFHSHPRATGDLDARQGFSKSPRRKILPEKMTFALTLVEERRCYRKRHRIAPTHR